MPKKPGFSLRQHDQLGEELQLMRDKLIDIYVGVSKAYGKGTADLALRARKAIDKLRYKMDDKVCGEQWGNQNIEATKIYFRDNRDGSAISLKGSAAGPADQKHLLPVKSSTRKLTGY
jgi:hypothetical protein